MRPVPISNISGTISLPEIYSHTGLFNITSSSNQADSVICPTMLMYMPSLEMIKSRDLACWVERDPDINLDKLDELLNSGDGEAKELAMTLISKNTIYTADILRVVRDDNTLGAETIITTFYIRNTTSITKNIK